MPGSVELAVLIDDAVDGDNASPSMVSIVDVSGGERGTIVAG